MRKSYFIRNTISGLQIGIYEACSEFAALDAMAIDQGYSSYAVLLDTIGGNGSDIEVVEESAAYGAGFLAGSTWELDGFDSFEEAALTTTGWSTATINAMGLSWFRAVCGLNEDEDTDEACEDYNRGAVAAITERAQ